MSIIGLTTKERGINDIGSETLPALSFTTISYSSTDPSAANEPLTTPAFSSTFIAEPLTVTDETSTPLILSVALKLITKLPFESDVDSVM